ncbi:hypothetical protein ACVW1A_002091 [Bradyrhizobium sp. LB1.3]
MAEERPDLPYEKAVEEAAKTLSKAVEVVEIRLASHRRHLRLDGRRSRE